MSKVRAGFNIDKVDWDNFKTYCVQQGSNASTELRRFINIYNKYQRSEQPGVKNDFFAKIQLEK